ncbi:MAG TPA: peptidoglycan-binding domain-containing protein [Chthoniobacterales bacterium]|nr:peptidoglycan-binding domain-containing protein [Chthoniobacterales bacterium]
MAECLPEILGGDRRLNGTRINLRAALREAAPIMRWLGLFLVLFLLATPLRADEQVRQVQEELRKRNLYFGDIDGQVTPELSNALKRYQVRKGFAVTGTINRETATSLNVQPEFAASRPAASPLPDVPVLRSDTARELPQEQRVALEQQAQENPEPPPSPPPPAEQPPPSPQLNRERVRALVEQYLRDSETFDVPAQTRYFTYPVEYFDHGSVGAEFVEKDVRNYVKRWPERRYTLEEPIAIAASAREGEAMVAFPITFEVRNKKHTARGRTQNFWTLRAEGDDLKIVAIREQRLRE